MVQKNLTVYCLASNARLPVTSGSVHCRNNRPYTIMVAGKLSFATFQSHLSPEARAQYISCDVKDRNQTDAMMHVAQDATESALNVVDLVT